MSQVPQEWARTGAVRVLEALLERLSSKGSLLDVEGEDGTVDGPWLIDSWVVVRGPESRAADKPFWVTWRPAGYDADWHNTHTIKVVKWWLGEDTANLYDDQSRCHCIHLLDRKQEPAMADDWRSWQDYKKRHVTSLAELDLRLLAEQQVIAEEWPE